MMMEWGTCKADELDLECFVEASVQGYQLYSKHGFRAQRVAELTLGPATDEKSEEWKACRELTTGLNCCVMKRRKKGQWPASDRYILPQGSLATNIWENGDQI